MSVMKRLLEERGRSRKDVYTIGPNNPFVGNQVRCTWLKPWQKKPIGHTVIGELVETFTPNGRAMIGRVRTAGFTGCVIVNCPWSRKYLEVEVL